MSGQLVTYLLLLLCASMALTKNVKRSDDDDDDNDSEGQPTLKAGTLAAIPECYEMDVSVPSTVDHEEIFVKKEPSKKLVDLVFMDTTIPPEGCTYNHTDDVINVYGICNSGLQFCLEPKQP